MGVIIATVGITTVGVTYGGQVTAAAAPVSTCSDEVRTAALRSDQERLVRLVGDLETLRGPLDLARLAAQLGYGPYAHGFVSYEGIGVTMVHPIRSLEVLGVPVTTVTSGVPFGLLYRPGSGDITDPAVPDFPYRLAGWFYSATYTPGVAPASPGWCVEPSDWFIHERGVHRLPDFDMVMQPPTEDWYGQREAPVGLPVPPGIPHGRVWDLHVWLDRESGTPRLGPETPFGNIPGARGHAQMAFRYPERAPVARRP